MSKPKESKVGELLRLENLAIVKGFIAARSGELKTANPYSVMFNTFALDAWDYGYDCWHSNVLPWALERECLKGQNLVSARKARVDFRDTRELPPVLVAFLERHSG